MICNQYPPYYNPSGLILNSLSFIKFSFYVFILKSYLLDLNFYVPQMWYYLPNGHWPLKRSVEQLGNHTVLNLHIILKLNLQY